MTSFTPAEKAAQREAALVLDDDVRSRFDSFVNKTEHCWLWTGAVSVGGYGQFVLGSKRYTAHRIGYLLAGRAIPAGLVLDHACRVRECVNPDHLRPTTNRENVLIGIGLSAINARKTHCHRGHEFTPENTRVDAEGFRVCRKCAYLRRECRVCGEELYRSHAARHAARKHPGRAA